MMMIQCLVFRNGFIKAGQRIFPVNPSDDVLLILLCSVPKREALYSTFVVRNKQGRETESGNYMHTSLIHSSITTDSNSKRAKQRLCNPHLVSSSSLPYSPSSRSFHLFAISHGRTLQPSSRPFFLLSPSKAIQIKPTSL